VTNEEGDLPLHVACRTASPTVISYILNSCPQAVHFKNQNLQLPLHYACDREKAIPLEVIGELVHAWPEACHVACPYQES